MRTTIVFLFCYCSGLGWAQGPDISAYFRANKTATPVYTWMRVDAPLTAGQSVDKSFHIGLDLTNLAVRTSPPSAAGACSQNNLWAADSAYVYMCVAVNGNLAWARTPLSTNWNPTTNDDKISAVGGNYNEVPTPSGQSAWTLAAVPFGPVICYRNGLHQVMGVDFTVNDKTIIATGWSPSDKLVCDYKYVAEIVTAPTPAPPVN